MKSKTKSLSRIRIGLLIFGAHTIFLIVKLIPVYLLTFQNPDVARMLSTIVFRLASYYYLLALITPLILWAGLLLPLGKRHLARNLGLHVLIAITLALLHIYAYGYTTLATLSGSAENFRAEYFSFDSMLNNGLSSFVFYGTIIAIQQAYLYFRQLQERELRLRQAELDMLKKQLQPHFLFNALNAIATLVHKSPQDADQTLMQLSDLLRISLKHGKAQEVTLKEEMEFLQSYLQIHQTLMKQRLEVKCNIQPETLDAMLPNMMLQPIVENSIKHGIAPIERGGLIEITARRHNGTLNLLMSDNGKGFRSEQSNDSEGIGLNNTRARLKNLYGTAHKFQITSPPNGGFTVEIEIPFREQSREAE